MQKYAESRHRNREERMITVEIKVEDIKFAKNMSSRFGNRSNANIRKASECPECGEEVTWYLFSGETCQHCGQDVPPISDITESLPIRLLYCQGVKKINVHLWRNA